MFKSLLKFFGLVFFTITTFAICAKADFFIPDRRDNPTRLQIGFIGFPIYTHVPGIGSSYGVGFLASNIFDTRAVSEGTLTFGDMATDILGLNEVHVIPDHLVFGGYIYSTKIPFQYFDRGTLSDPSKYFFSINKEYGASLVTNVHLWERRIQLNSIVGPSRLQYQSVVGSDGTRYSNLDSQVHDSLGMTFRFQLDFTDDIVDPRQGMRLEIIRDHTDVFDQLHSRQFTLDGNFSVYIPVFETSTWVFNAFESKANVWSQNTLSQAQLQSAMGLNCAAISDPVAQAKCQATENQRIQNRLIENQYGSSAPLGGPNQFRGFGLGRFVGSTTVFYASELRLNIIDAHRTFDLGFIKGTLSEIQVAPFYELATVVDPPVGVPKGVYRSNYGVGFRIGFSGMVVRADMGISNEGTQFTFFTGYPFDISPF